MRPAVFLDRDGVLNLSELRAGKPYAPRRCADFQLYPEALPALRRLSDAGFLLIVVTNQPDIGNNLADPAEVAAMNAQLAAVLPVAEVVMCPHSQSAGCACRKPRPGMLLDAALRHDIDLTASVMVGDRAGDVAAGQAAGCRTIWIDRGYAEPAPSNPDRIVASLSTAVDAILANFRNDVSGDDIQ
ncbi:MAG TPA: HAD-IIIA family hydrolase [Patescibacteria group bacterium]|nr:HAD-IIIA family hydrolase [Patescibacteria group bacterium]